MARKPRTSPETLERGRFRRMQIVDAAIELFSTSGYRGTGLAGIAAQVGVTQAGLLHHFGSKEKLLEAVVQHRSAQDAAVVEEIIGDGGIAMFDRLVLLARHNTRRAGLSQLFTVLVAENLLPEHPAHDFFRDRYRHLRSVVVAAMRKGVERGEIRADADLDLAGARLIAAMDGLQTQWLLDPKQVSLIAAFQELGASFRRELAVSEPPV